MRNNGVLFDFSNDCITVKGKTKFFIRWSGPWKIVKVISDVTYRIQLIDKGKRRRVRQVVHFNRLKKCYVDEANERSQNERDSGNAGLGPHPNNDTVILKSRGEFARKVIQGMKT